MVLRISLTKWSSYWDMQLSSQLLGLFQFSSFPSPTGFSVRLTSICLRHSPDLQLLLLLQLQHGYACMIIFISFWIYDKLTILSEKQKVAHNQLNAEGLASSGAQKAIKELGHWDGKDNTSLSPLSEGRGKKKKTNSFHDKQDLFQHFFNTMMVPLGWGLLSDSSVWEGMEGREFWWQWASRDLNKTKQKPSAKKVTINNCAKILIFRINNLDWYLSF